MNILGNLVPKVKTETRVVSSVITTPYSGMITLRFQAVCSRGTGTPDLIDVHMRAGEAEQLVQYLSLAISELRQS